jgi:hypothetical protein
MRNRTGLSLIDLLISMAIFAVVSVAFITVFITIINVQTHQASQTEVTQQSQFLLQQLQYYVQSSRLIDMSLDTSASTLTLRMPSPALDPTIVSVVSGTVYLQQGSGALQALTSNRVSVTSTIFTRHYNLGSSTAFGTDSVSLSFVTSENTSNTVRNYSSTVQSSVAVLAPVAKIALIQQTKTESNNSSVASIVASYGSKNESSSLLLALEANTTSSASVSVSDSAGNTWSKIGTLTYPAYNEEMNLFAALNAKNSSNTVTATLGAGAGFGSLYIYEYRGALTASSFDASSTQLNPGTKTPSSGSASATSSAELLFAATYNGSTAEIPAAGSGFTTETSSTVTHIFAEDSGQYITGPVSASWQYTNTTPSSSALIATFR